MTQITKSVRLEERGEIALVIIDNPPVNALSQHVREGIVEGIAAAQATDAVGIVLICDGRTFIAGADITEFGQAPQAPSLQDVQGALEGSTKPVIAAIHGTALGGGLEIAMCAHYRVASAGAKFGLPEVKLGLLPGAGGTQRLPRVVGPLKALQMMTSGDPIGADDALAAGLISEIVDDLEAGAVAFASKAAAEKMPLLKIRDQNALVDGVGPELFADFRKSIARKTRGFDAPELNVQCVEAAVNLDFEAGLAKERELFTTLMQGSQSQAQQYYFFSERAANKVPDVPRDTPKIPINSAGILGAGTMGGGIAMNFANAGIPVTMVERSQEALDRGLAVVRKNYERSASSGRITSDDVETRMGLITGSTDMGNFADCDIVIEAVFEDLDLKKSIFTDLDGICKPGAIMASNTSALNLNEIAAATSRPESVIGLHFFSPANVMKLLEIVRGDATSKEVIATAMGLAKTIGKIPVLCGVCHGFIGNRMLFSRRLEANAMILEGATPAQVDKVLFDYGFPMGPFAMSDLAGLDIGWNEAESSSSTLRDVICESGRRGQKNGRGFYTYDPETRASTPDPEVEQMVRDWAAKEGIQQREVTDQEILERCLYPMINEGAKILEEGIAIRGSDIDVVWINGYGWPRYTGGPMFWADSIGAAEVVAKIKQYSESVGGSHWELSPLLAQIAEDGGRLSSYTS